MSRTRIKICGLTRASDAAFAAQLGVDAAGLVFVPESARALTMEQAVGMRRQWPPLLDLVALFADPEKELVETVAAALRPTVLQFHGSESADFCASFGYPYIKAVEADAAMHSENVLAAYRDSAAALLIDARTGSSGGGGRSFDWDSWAETAPDIQMPWLLAGGLAPNNVGDAVRKLHPYGVDVSSGVERERGVKDRALMRLFVNKVQEADAIINEYEDRTNDTAG